MSRSLRRREQVLEASERLLQHLETALRYTAQPPRQLICRALQALGLAQLPYLAHWEDGVSEDFLVQWNDGIEAAVACGELQAEDAALLKAFGQGLGQSDISGQTAHIRLYTERLHTAWEDARQASQKRARLYVTLGVLGGAALALLLV